MRRHPAARTFSSSAQFALPAFGAGLAEAGADDAQRPHTLREAVLHRAQHLRRRHDDDREVHGSGNVRHARVRAKPWISLGRRDAPGRRVPVNPAARRLWRISAPIFPRSPIRADHGDRARLEERLHRRRRRQLRAPRGLLEVIGRQLERQFDVKDAAIDPARHAIARIEEHVDHLAVLGQHEGIERRRSAPRRAMSASALEQPCSDAASLQASAIANATSARSDAHRQSGSSPANATMRPPHSPTSAVPAGGTRGRVVRRCAIQVRDAEEAEVAALR